MKQRIYKWITGYTFRDKAIMIILAMMLSLFMCIGDTFQEKSFLLNLCQHNKILGYLSMWILYFIVLLVITVAIDYWVTAYREKKNKDDRGFSVKTWRIFKCILLIAWIPYFMTYFPGSISRDGMIQVNIARGSAPLSNAHPIISTWCMGIFIKIGKWINNDYLGIFLYVLFQTFVMISALVYMLRFVHELTKNKTIIYIALAFFALYPTWGMMVESVIKDTLYTAFFILFTTMFAQIVMDKEEKTKDRMFLFKFFLSMIGICFWRNNGIYVVIISFIVLLISKTMKSYKKSVAFMLALIMLLYYGMNAWVYPMLNVQKGSTREMLSLPFQQTARYLRDNPQDVTEDEKKIISAVLDYEKIPELYNPNIADYARNTFRENSTSEELKKYFIVWLKMFFKHPETYFKATLNNTYNYYYFKDMRNFMSEYQNYTAWDINELAIEENKFEFTNNCKVILEKYLGVINRIPFVNHLGRCGLFTWVVLIAFALMFRRKEFAGMILCVPLFVAILICIASPVNGLQRYMWCVMGTIWVPLAALFSRKETKEEVKECMIE